MNNVKNVQKNEFRDQLKIEGVMSRGYGIMPKMVTLDRKLTIEAKAIYSYFVSYAGAGTTAFPSVKKIYEDLCISENRFYKHLKVLKEYGYIKVEHRTDKKGKFTSNIYTLITHPKAINPNSKNDNLPNLQNKGMDKLPYLQNECMENTCMENEGTNTNISNKINNFSINNTTTTVCTYSKEEIGNEEKVVVENKRKNKFTQKDIEELNKRINNQINTEVKEITIKNVLKKFGYDYAITVINKLSNIISKTVMSIDSFFYKAVEAEANGTPYIAKPYKADYHQRPVQCTNYEQRTYSDEFWDSCYDNI